MSAKGQHVLFKARRNEKKNTNCFFVCVKNHLFSITTPKQEASLLSLFADILRRSVEFGVVTGGCVWYDAPSDPVKLLMQDTRALMNFLFSPLETWFTD